MSDDAKVKFMAAAENAYAELQRRGMPKKLQIYVRDASDPDLASGYSVVMNMAEG